SIDKAVFNKKTWHFAYILTDYLRMKSITVPYIPHLNDTTAEVAADFLEEEGKKGNIEQLNWGNDYPYKPITFFGIGRSRSHLFIKYSVKGNVLRAVNHEDQTPVWEDSCVEFFCAVPDGSGYMNFEFNCIGSCYAALYDQPRQGKLRSLNEMRRILRFPSLEPIPFNEMEGHFEWELTVGIPFDLLGLDGEHLPAGIRANFYKCADATSLKHYLSWNPIHTEFPDFHRPDFFGELFFD
ncbi:MAG: carbohydrate-binding family 9-like protein, partial [Microbacter sp.]